MRGTGRGLAALLLFLAAPLFADEPALTFKRGGEVVVRLTLSELKKKVPARTVSEDDPFYGGRKKTFRCFPIAKLMAAAYGKGWLDGVHTEVSLVAVDGYASQSRAAKLDDADGCLAFKDAAFANWEPIGYKKANPAPFYLVWAHPGKTVENEYPWPWQLATIDLIRFETAYPEVVPRGAAEGSSAYKGFLVFRGRCMRCHAINQQGGRIGPDLNAPQSVAVYRTRDWIKSFVKQPSKYRYTEMPDHLDLSDADLDALYDFFKLKSTQPEKKAF